VAIGWALIEYMGVGPWAKADTECRGLTLDVETTGVAAMTCAVAPAASAARAIGRCSNDASTESGR
jgi:hypothetical protein